jgi:hypothetical protein
VSSGAAPASLFVIHGTKKPAAETKRVSRKDNLRAALRSAYKAAKEDKGEEAFLDAMEGAIGFGALPGDD